MRVYISGKITGTPDYLIRFEQAAKKLAKRGYEVVNPALVCLPLPTTFTHNQYMDVCMAALKACDAIYMLSGWEKSHGAKAECEWAMFNGLKIMSEEADG